MTDDCQRRECKESFEKTVADDTRSVLAENMQKLSNGSIPGYR